MKRIVVRSVFGIVLAVSGCGTDSGIGGPGGSGGVTGTGGSGGGMAQPQVVLTVEQDVVRVRQGDEVALEVEVSRSGGFQGAVQVGTTGLPDGVSAEPAVIDASGSSALLTISAQDDAPMAGPLDLTLTATSTDASPPVTDSASIDLYVAGPPGTFDTSFSFDGVVRYFVGGEGESEVPTGLAIDSQGRLWVAGSSQGAMQPTEGWILRFLEDGTVDSSFGTAGELRGFDRGEPESVVSALALREDEVFVLAAGANATTTTRYIRALDSNGSVVDTFGIAGDAAVPSTIRELVLRSSGFLAYRGQPPQMIGLTSSGDLDASFQGPVATPTNFTAVTVDGEDRIVYGGNNPGGPFTVGRLLPDGSVDTSFGDGGALTVPMPPDHSETLVSSIATFPDHGGVVLAQAKSIPNSAFTPILIRFGPDGTIDPSFGSGGVASVLGPAQTGYGEHVRLQEGGVMVVAGGIAASTFQATWTIKRFQPDGSVDTSFGEAGQAELERPARLFAIDRRAGRVVAVSDPIGIGSTLGGLLIARLWL